jgi:hypothetical protein
MKRIIPTVCILCAALILLTGCSASKSGGDAYQKGTLTATSMESEFLNLKFTLPSGYYMASEQDLIDLMDFGAEIVYADKDKKLVDYTKANTVYEMMASTQEGLPNVSVIVEKLPLSSLTVDQYIEAFKAQLADMDMMSVSFSGGAETGMFAGKSYQKLSAVTTAYDMEMLQEYLVRKIDNRIVCITITYTADTAKEMNTLMAGFSALS